MQPRLPLQLPLARTYRLDGLLATQAFPSSLTETPAYDELKRPTSISLGGAGSISQTFDRGGRITSDGRSLTTPTGDAGTGTQTFTYDALSRLTASSGLALSRSYQYDLDGNRTRRVEGTVTTDFSYDRADQLINQTIGITTKSYDYDRYGNMVQSADPASGLTTYVYDEANRLKTISPPGGAATQVTFTLDALDRHATRLVNGTLTDTYAYLDATETAHQTGTGTPTTALLDADGTRLAVKTNGNVNWLVFDLHGSVVALCPAGSSTLSDAYRFDGWGQQIHAWSSGAAATNPWRYRGLLNIGSGWDAGALLDMVSRDYSPQLGTFTQQDSVQGGAANPMTMNRFLYALSNPATLIDPDGHAAFVDYGTTTTAPAVAREKQLEDRHIAYDRPSPRDCGFDSLGCRSDGAATALGFGFGVGQWAWDTGAGIGHLAWSGVDNGLCTMNPFCGPARAQENLQYAALRDAQLKRDWADSGAALGAGFDGIKNGIGELADHITNAPSGFEAAREVGYAGANVTSAVLPVAAAAKAAWLARAGRLTQATVGAAAERGSIMVDTNALIRGIQRGDMAALDAALAGRTPLVAPQSLAEYAVKGDAAAVKAFLAERGGRIVEAQPEIAAALRNVRSVTGGSLKVGDSEVLACAMACRAPVLLSGDTRFWNFMEGFGWPAERF